MVASQLVLGRERPIGDDAQEHGWSAHRLHDAPEFGTVKRDYLAGGEGPTLRRPHSQHAACGENQMLAGVRVAAGALRVARHIQLGVREVLQHRDLCSGASSVKEQQLQNFLS
jgi:hypothetical protein